VVNTIPVEIDEADAVVLTLGVHNCDPAWKRIQKALPGLFSGTPSEHRVLRFIGNDQLGHTVAVHVTQSRAAVVSALGRKKRLAVYHKSIEQRRVEDPLFTVKSPGAGLRFAPRQHDGLVRVTYNAKTHAGVLMTSAVRQRNDGSREIGLNPHLVTWPPDARFAHLIVGDHDVKETVVV